MFEFKEQFSDPKRPLGLVREQVDGQEVTKLRGPFQEMNDIRGNKNKNGRVYTKDLWEKALADKGFQERMANKRVVGELDHPTDDGQIRRTSHFVTKVWPDYNEGIVYGEIELLNHNQGDAALLRALVEQGMQVCVSSRGFGDFLKDGCTVDPETYKLHTWDIVLDPSVPVAALNRVAESVNEKMAPESKARTHFIEVAPLPVCKGSGCKSHKQESEKIDNLKQEKEQMDPKIMELMEKNAALAVDKAKLESANESLRALVTEKNSAIDKCEKHIATIGEKLVASDAKGVALTEDLRKANEAKNLAEGTVKEYESIEDRAISTIGALREQVAEYDATGDKAADLIESLRAQVKGLSKKNEGKKPSKKNEGKGRKNEAGEEDLEKIDKNKKAAGELRSWEPGSKGEEAEGEDDDELPVKDEDKAVDEPTEDDPVAKAQKQQDEEAEGEDGEEDDDEKPQVDEGEEEEEEGKGKKDEEEEEEEPEAEKGKKPAFLGKEEAKRASMLKTLSESMIANQKPRKVR
jgi:uncharacterized coiled-coil protein SlyX